MMDFIRNEVLGTKTPDPNLIPLFMDILVISQHKILLHFDYLGTYISVKLSDIYVLGFALIHTLLVLGFLFLWCILVH